MSGRRFIKDRPIPHGGIHRQDWLLEVARTIRDPRQRKREDGRVGKPSGRPRRGPQPRDIDYVKLAEADGFRPTSVDQGRQVLRRFARFLSRDSTEDLENVGWQEYASYKSYLAQSGVSRATAKCYMFYIASFYRLRAQASQDGELLDDYMRVRAIGVGRPRKGRRWLPLKREVVCRLLEAAKGEDRVFLKLLLYTGGRAQFYGLRVKQVDFDRAEITADVKAGKIVTLPLHPKLAEVLKEHLASRSYNSPWLFRNGRDGNTLRGQRANRQNAWRICKRAQKLAGVQESVHPHRFRKTLAAFVCEAGLEPQFLQAIMAHTRIESTLDDYAQVGMNDLKKRFAALDLVRRPSAAEPGMSEARVLLEQLRRHGPAGKEHAWAQLIDGLGGLIAS